MGTTWWGIGIGWVGLAVALLLVAGVAGRSLWSVTRFWVTLVHEGGHAAITLVTPGRVRRILVHANSSAETWPEADEDGSVGVLFYLCGYPAPSLLGLAGVFAVTRGWSTPAMAGGLVVLGFLLVLMRNLLGAGVALVLGAAFGAFLYYAPASGRPLFVLVASWVLLLGAVRAAYEQYSCTDPGDADSLGEISAFPPEVWRGFFLGFSITAACFAGWLAFFVG